MSLDFEGHNDGSDESRPADFEAAAGPDPSTDAETAGAMTLRLKREIAQVRLNELFGDLYIAPEPDVNCVDVDTGTGRYPYRLYMN